MTREKNIIYIARLVSLIFTPFYLPLVGLIALFTFSYLNLLPVAYRLLVLAIIYLFTILMPTFFIHLYRRAQGWSLLELGQKRRRMVPYGISIVCYGACLWTLDKIHIYHFVSSIVLAALLVQIICAIINIWWKISTHTAGIGCTVCLCRIFCIQPRVVALRCTYPGRHSRLSPHHPASALTLAGGGRIPHRICLCHHGNSILLKNI